MEQAVKDESYQSRATSRKGIAWFLQAMFILPVSQVKIFDLAYQFYAFEVFHMFWPNRWSHFIGIPISLAATYILLSPLPFGAELALAVVVGIQLAICVRARIYALIPVVLALQGLLWYFAMNWLDQYFVFDGAWYMHPAFHVVIWPTLQYVTHMLEEFVPPPWSMNGSDWMRTKEFIFTAPKTKVLTSMLFAPFHAIVELVSSHRNSFLMIVLAAEKLGYRPAHLATLRQWINHECAKANTHVIEYEDFAAAWGRWQSARQSAA